MAAHGGEGGETSDAKKISQDYEEKDHAQQPAQGRSDHNGREKDGSAIRRGSAAA